MEQLSKHIEWDAQEHQELNESITKIHLALFGDGNGNKGLVDKVDEMHKVFTSTNWAISFVIKTFGAIGVVAGTILALYTLFKK